MSLVSLVIGTDNILSATPPTPSTFRDPRTQTPKMKSPESSHSENWDQLAALMASDPAALLVQGRQWTENHQWDSEGTFVHTLFIRIDVICVGDKIVLFMFFIYMVFVMILNYLCQ